jgi:hypothetical protein
MSFLKIKGKNPNVNLKSSDVKHNSKESKTVQELLDINSISSISNNIIQNTNMSKYYIKIMPKNINIMTDEYLLNEIQNLKSVCNIAENIEFLAVDKVERLEDNKNYLNDLFESATDETFKMLLMRDIEYFRELESSKSSSREFYIIIEFRNSEFAKNKQIFENVEQALNDKGFTILNTNKDTLKNMLQTYFERNFTGDIIKDFDI